MKRLISWIALVLCFLAVPRPSRASTIPTVNIAPIGQDNTDCSRSLYRVTAAASMLFCDGNPNPVPPWNGCRDGGNTFVIYAFPTHYHCIETWYATCGGSSGWYAYNRWTWESACAQDPLPSGIYPNPTCPPTSCEGVFQLAYDDVLAAHGSAYLTTGCEDLVVQFPSGGVEVRSESSTVSPLYGCAYGGQCRDVTRVHEVSVPAETTFTARAEITSNLGGGFQWPWASESATAPPSACLVAPPSLGGSSGNGYCGIGSKVNYSGGDLYDSVTLFTMKGSGPPTVLTLSYNSLDPAVVPLGPGWTHNFAMRLTDLASTSLTLAEEDGRRIAFWETSPGSGTFLPEVQSNRQGVSIQKFADGAYRMTRKDGTTDDFDAQGRLTAKRDRNGNAITLSYTGSDLNQIADSSGRVVSLSYDASHRIAYVTDPAGRSWAFVYDGGGHLASIADPQGGVRSYTYDGSGRMVSKTDPAGNQTGYAYDASGKLASATDPTGTPAFVSYSPGTSQASVTGRNGGVTATTYDPNLDAPTRVTAPDGSVTTYTYDGYGNVLSATDAAGRATTYAYDAFGNRTSVTDPLGHVTTYAYNGFGQVTSATDPEGRTTSYAYDAKGNVLSLTDPSGAATQYGYDARGNVTSVTRPGGRTTAFSYDAYGNLATATDPAGLVTTFSSDVLGNLLSRTDPNGAVTAYAYDNASRLTRVTDPLGNATAFAYDGNGNRTSATDPLGRATLWTYSERNRPLTMTDPLGHVTTYTYTFGGCSSCGSGGDLLASTTDANGHTTRYEYDMSGRLTKVIDPLGNETRYAYDTLGNRTLQTDANGRVTSFAYDSLSRMTSQTDPLGGVASFAYFAVGQTATVTDAGGNATSYAYDAAGRVRQVSSPDTGATTYAYNGDGTLSSKTDARGTAATYSYDAAGRLARIAFPAPAEDIFFYYDSTGSTFGRGRLTSMTDPSGTTTYQYDALGRVTQEVKTVLGVAYTTSYAYDGAGNLLSIRYPSGRVVEYGYNGINRVISASGTKGGTTTTLASGIAYDAAGNLSSLPLGNGVVQDHSYDGANRLLSVVVHAPWTVAASWTYDNVGNVTQITDNLSVPPTRSYSYDPLDRLNQASGLFGNFSWTYDPNGNRLTQQAGATTTTYTYQANRLATVAGGTSGTYTYDGSGNPTGDGTQSYVYDGNGRLTKLFNSGVLAAEYVYDGKGRRVAKKRYTYTVVKKETVTTITTTVYHYDLSGKPIGETDGGGNFAVDYLYLENQPLAMVRKSWSGESAYWYHNDHLGMPRVMTDASGGGEWRIEFDPFGNKTAVSVEYVVNNLRFPGQYFDAESGLHYNYFRYYDPKTGRYIEPDPIGLRGGLNPYPYVRGNPINRVDRFGLQDCSQKDCESCEWIVDQGGTAGAALFIGYSRTPTEFRCRGGNKRCRGVIVCSSLGLQIGAGFQWNIDFESTIGTGSIITGVCKSDDLENYVFTSWNIGAGRYTTSGSNIAVGFWSVGGGVAKQWCTIEYFSCR